MNRVCKPVGLPCNAAGSGVPGMAHLPSTTPGNLERSANCFAPASLPSPRRAAALSRILPSTATPNNKAHPAAPASYLLHFVPQPRGRSVAHLAQYLRRNLLRGEHLALAAERDCMREVPGIALVSVQASSKGPCRGQGAGAVARQLRQRGGGEMQCVVAMLRRPITRPQGQLADAAP